MNFVPLTSTILELLVPKVAAKSGVMHKFGCSSLKIGALRQAPKSAKLVQFRPTLYINL